MFWSVTATHVKDAIYEDVSTKDIARASSMIDIYVNRTEAASGAMSARDIHWIRQAVIWQSAWCRDNPDVQARMVVAEHSQDQTKMTAQAGGQSGNVREWTWTLAPMAARALKNLSWKANRGQAMPRGGVGPIPADSFLQGDYDACSPGEWCEL